jgi:glycosyltransferase involved in cell wall biosynthesis
MRSGVPIVATRVGGIPEVLGEVPWVVPPEDEVLLARAVTALLTDDDARHRWSAELETRFRDRYTVAAAADRVLQVYQEVVGAGVTAAPHPVSAHA